MFYKVSVWPSLMIETSSASASTLSVAQDASESRPNPSIYRLEDVPVTMFEIFKPAFQIAVQHGDDHSQAVPVGAFGRTSDGFFEFHQALPARLFPALLEMISEKVEAAWRRRIHHARLVWVQLQFCLRSPMLQQFQGSSGFPFALAHDHQIIRITCHLKARFFHQMVQRIKINVRQQWTGYASYNVANCPLRGSVQKGVDLP